MCSALSMSIYATSSFVVVGDDELVAVDHDVGGRRLWQRTEVQLRRCIGLRLFE